MTISRVWNLGLPRTGTTSTAAALSKIGMRCYPIAAQWVAQTLTRRRSTGFEPQVLNPPPGTLFVASWRDLPDWQESMLRWRPNADPGLLITIFSEYVEWLSVQETERSIGLFEVHRGWPGLFAALSKATKGENLPHLNKSPVSTTIESEPFAEIAG